MRCLPGTVYAKTTPGVDLAPDPRAIFLVHLQEIPRFSLCFWPSRGTAVLLSRASCSWSLVAPGGPPKAVLPPTFVPRVPQAPGRFPSKYDMEREVFTKRN